MPNEQANKAAEHIIKDRHGADYYQDVKLLAQYLKGTLGLSQEEAVHIAAEIQQDRKGANYYENSEILAEFLHR